MAQLDRVVRNARQAPQAIRHRGALQGDASPPATAPASGAGTAEPGAV